MNLPEYKRRFGVQYKFIAEKCGCTPEMISMVATGKIKPSFDLAAKIEMATNGYVSHENWYQPPFHYVTASVVVNGVSA